jgi:hypothetical protein
MFLIKYFFPCQLKTIIFVPVILKVFLKPVDTIDCYFSVLNENVSLFNLLFVHSVKEEWICSCVSYSQPIDSHGDAQIFNTRLSLKRFVHAKYLIRQPASAENDEYYPHTTDQILRPNELQYQQECRRLN